MGNSLILVIKNSSRLLFCLTLLAGTFIVVSSTSWLGCWVGLEINLLSFIPLIYKITRFASEAALKYFLVQALASSILLLIIILFSLQEHLTSAAETVGFIALNWLIIISLLLKIGAAPFHFWFPGVAEGLSWINLAILITWQKVAPFILVRYTTHTSLLIISCILFSSLMGAVGGFNQTSLRKLIAFSSINHIAWILAAFLISDILWVSYFFLYSILSLAILNLFQILNIRYLRQLSSLGNLTPQIKLLTFGSLLSIGGLPPFLGFLPKWLVIYNLVNVNITSIAVWIVFISLITLYFYIRIAYSSLVLTHSELKWIQSYRPTPNLFTTTLSILSIGGLAFSSLYLFVI